MDKSILTIVLEFIASLFQGQPEVKIEIPLDKKKQAVPNSGSNEPNSGPSVDWSNPEDSITEHFKVKDALTLHSWNKLATMADGVDFDRIIKLCNKMEEIRKILNCPINVHCMYRSVAYNEAQHIKPAADVHSMSMACDFDCNSHLTIQEIKDILEPKLEELQIRMEFGTATWIHIDFHNVGPSGRYFKV